MPKPKIELPADFPFATRLEVRITDINYGGHLGNDAVLALVHEARLRYLKTLDASEMAVGDGVGLIMSGAQVLFCAEGLYGMELEIAVAAVEPGSAGFDLVYRLTDTASGREIARVLTSMVCFDYARRRPVRLPEAFRLRLGGAGA